MVGRRPPSAALRAGLTHPTRFPPTLTPTMELRLPELGEGIADATVVNVPVRPGQPVKAGDKVKVGAVIAVVGDGKPQAAPAAPPAAKPVPSAKPQAAQAATPQAAPAAGG